MQNEVHEPAREDHLTEIHEEIRELKRQTLSWKTWFLRGILYGVGALVGSIVAVALFGWVLSLMGVIPGFGELAEYLRGLMDLR